ncbi:S-layer homology domain-containing protein [Lysinibacillus endophyticus]|uniref:S-layer homology domain-containing protein n=1 Tax=Ureibacillus endophyticus TaxID=1978490 RepID=UPI0031375110
MVLKRYISFVFVTVFVVSLMMPQISAKARAVEFSDVSNDQPYASAVSQLTERKIIGGYPDGTFKPEASITRGQAAAIIAKLLNLDTKIV